jgi:hypothetical protein
MKNVTLIVLSFITLSAMITSCKTHDHCAAYTKINKIKTEKDFLRIQVKSI